MKKRCLISVSDKSGVAEFARELEGLGYEVISTGGTFAHLMQNGIKAVEVSDITGFPECLDGRVKTLHPKIHAGILAMRDNPEHMRQIEELEVDTIDIVAINLYPFKQTILKENVEFEDAIENIDIGGPTMIRAAAKNYGDVAVIVDPGDYGAVVAELRVDGCVSRQTKINLAYKVFEHTAHYDALIAAYLRKTTEQAMFPNLLTLTFEKVQDMRYGENPHQAGVFYREVGNFGGCLTDAEQLHGKELSYNNINDANGALDLLKEFGEECCCVAVKHANPCGVGVADSAYGAYIRAFEADPVSIYGGIVALNRAVDKRTAEEMAKTFLEIIIAPDFDADALEILTQKKNIRLLKLPQIAKPNTKDMFDMKKVAGGLLVQERDVELYHKEDLRCVTKRQPSEAEMAAMDFAWKVVKHTKSNGIVLANDKSTLGIGPGQTNRITALELAIRYAGDAARGSVMASDAYLPFADCVEAAAKAGITAIIQPGGSVRDQESVDACDVFGIAMVFCGERHFKH